MKKNNSSREERSSSLPLTISVGKPFENEYGVMYFLKCFANPLIFQVSISSASFLASEKNPYSKESKATLILSDEDKKNSMEVQEKVALLVAQWMKIPVDSVAASYLHSPPSNLQSVHLSKVQQANGGITPFMSKKIIIVCDSLFQRKSDGYLFLRWRIQ